jgi:hypothetical protein
VIDSNMVRPIFAAPSAFGPGLAWWGMRNPAGFRGEEQGTGGETKKALDIYLVALAAARWAPADMTFLLQMGEKGDIAMIEREGLVAHFDSALLARARNIASVGGSNGLQWALLERTVSVHATLVIASGDLSIGALVAPLNPETVGTATFASSIPAGDDYIRARLEELAQRAAPAEIRRVLDTMEGA